MALTLDYNYRNVDIHNAYLKISSIVVKDGIAQPNTKIFNVDVEYEVRASQASSYFCIENVTFPGDPSEPLYLQSYNYLKSIYPLATDN
jgi:hypothetical protein